MRIDGYCLCDHYSIGFLKPMFGSSAEAMQELFPSAHGLLSRDMIYLQQCWQHLVGLTLMLTCMQCMHTARSIDSSLLTELLTTGLQGPETI